MEGSFWGLERECLQSMPVVAHNTVKSLQMPAKTHTPSRHIGHLSLPAGAQHLSHSVRPTVGNANGKVLYVYMYHMCMTRCRHHILSVIDTYRM
jgi:hypothetical protein